MTSPQSDHDVEVLGEWDHGMNDPTLVAKRHPNPNSAGQEEILKKAEQAISNMAPIQSSNPDVEVLGEWDHGMCDPTDMKGHPKANPSDEGILKRAEQAVEGAVKDLLRKGASATADSHMKEEYEAHTEEEVAGMKLCVKDVVHKDSFIAPC